MLLRVVAIASLLLSLAVPAAVADEDHGQANSGSSDPTLASGSTSVTVTPQGGSTSTALTCANRPSEWSTPIAGSQWISPNADCTTSLAAETFTYTLSFTIPSGASNLQLNGSVLADDNVGVSLNGNTILGGGSGGLSSATSFGTSSGFNTGSGNPNTLIFTVVNGGGPSGLDFRVTISGSGVSQVVIQSSEDNHGQCVATVAHETGHGRGHGEAVRNAAHDCGHGDDSGDGD